jgi:hypothetical protein
MKVSYGVTYECKWSKGKHNVSNDEKGNVKFKYGPLKIRGKVLHLSKSAEMVIVEMTHVCLYFFLRPFEMLRNAS